jgi:cephalosporin hydroxylase
MEYKDYVNQIGTSPFGIGIAQTWPQIGALFDDINKYKITLVIELGTFMGGLSDLLLYKQGVTPAEVGFHYFGVQLYKNEIHPRLQGHTQIRIGDIFDPNIIDEVRSLIDVNRGKVLVYCDGGDKPKEMRTYTKLLRPGDYIRVHDFPGEVTPEFLDKYMWEYEFMEEILPEKCRTLGYSFWRCE